MLFLIIRKEIAHNVLSLRFAVTYVLLFLLVPLVVLLMTGEYQERFQVFTNEVNKTQETIDGLEKIEDADEQFREMQRATFFGARPPRQMGLLARGVEGSLPTRVPSVTYSFFSSSEERLGKDILVETFQTPDFAYVVNIVISLLALVFVFDAICGEKERGTLKVLLTNSVPRDILLLGKWIGGYLSIAVPFIVAVLGGFVYVYVSGSLGADGDGLERFLLITAVALLYISTFYTLGLLISTLTHRTATALLVSLMVWIGFILVIPNLSPIVSELLSPAPSRQVIDAEKRAIDEEQRLLMEIAQKRQVYGRQDYEKMRQETQQRKDKLEKFYKEKTSAQVELGKNLARLSPSACSLLAMTRLAGTGPVLFEQFYQATTRYQQHYQEYRSGFYRSGVIEFSPSGTKVKDKDWFKADELPRFEMFEEPLDDSLNAALFDVLLLLIYNVFFFMLAYLFFLRYDVT